MPARRSSHGKAPVLKVVATTGEGMAQLAEAIVGS